MKTFKITYTYVNKYSTEIELEIEAEDETEAIKIAKQIENNNDLDYNLEKEVIDSRQCYLESIDANDANEVTDEISNA